MVKELLDSDGSETEDGGASIHDGDLKVNKEFAKRFEHNKKREELQRLEEKHGQSLRKRKRDEDASQESHGSDDDSTSESEDEGEFATEALDAEIMATLKAIRSKDPRVYDNSSTFYSPFDETTTVKDTAQSKQPSMHLRDYHRQNLLGGKPLEEDESEQRPLTYNEEQAQLKRTIVEEINAAAEESSDESEGEDNQDFLVTKKRHRVEPPPVLDVENADKDPETFLSNFMSSRAWASSTDRQLHPFESDDEEDEKRADEYEEAYNFRFEDPAKSNEKLRSHARDVAAKYSARREDVTGRKKQREIEKARKEAEKEVLREEKARLRKLKIEELGDKVRKIKRAAGIKVEDISPEQWSRLVDTDWDDDQWEKEMAARFGDTYYAEADVSSQDEAEASDAEREDNKKSRKRKKPRFDDDIDITDIVPDFQEHVQEVFSLSEDDLDKSVSRHESKKKKTKDESRKNAKKERRVIEQMVDDQMKMDMPITSAKASGFRYRDTSPTTFGLSARDILLADDSQLNQFAGLKKLASFRDPEKKRKDRKHLGKRARLRQWRKETFGDEEGVQNADLVPTPSNNKANDGSDVEVGGVDIRESHKKKRRRGKKQKLAIS